MKERINNEILKAGLVNFDIKTKYFFGLGFQEIRNQLENLGLDRHMEIELESTEIALLTPKGIVLQVRSDESNMIDLWGGSLECGESLGQCVAREFYEETGIQVPEKEFEFWEEYQHSYEYENGDKALFHSYRFTVTFDNIPNIVLNEESVGVVMFSKAEELPDAIAPEQRDFIEFLLNYLY